MSDDIGKHIQCLQGQASYRLWSVQIKSVLKSKGLWGFVDPGRPSPTQRSKQVTTSSGSTSTELEDEYDWQERVAKHKMDKGKAAGLLKQSLGQTIIMDVQYLDQP